MCDGCHGSYDVPAVTMDGIPIAIGRPKGCSDFAGLPILGVELYNSHGH